MYIFLFVISIAHPIQSMNLEITGKINLGQNWHHLYRAEQNSGSENSNENNDDSTHLSKRDFNAAIGDNIVYSENAGFGTKLIELFKNLNITNIVSNVQIHTDGVKHEKDVSFKHKPKKSEEDSNEKHNLKHKHHEKERKNKHSTSIVGYPSDNEEKPKESKHDKKSNHDDKSKHDRESKHDKVTVSESLDDDKKDALRSKHAKKGTFNQIKGNKIEDKEGAINKIKGNKRDKEGTFKQIVEIIKDELVGNISETKNVSTEATHKPKVTDLLNKKNKHDLLKVIRVKDDPQLVEHIRHIHAQSLKVINDLKSKTDNYQLKKDIDLVLKSYDEKFKEFVKENKYHRIRSRLGKKKVILNAAEMSNNILERLVTYVRSKVEASGLRSGVPNVFHNAIQQKKELENQRMCKKFAICRSRTTFRHFLIEMLSIVLNSNDDKVQNFHDAMTEVLKTRDFSKIMDSGTKKKFLKAIKHMELYDLMTIRASYFIIRNILEKIHEPIKVTTKNMKSVNKTVAFIDLEDMFEDKIAPNENNKLEWDDMLTSLRQWSRDERKDIVEIFQTVVDHVMKAIDAFDDETTRQVQNQLNKMMIK